MRGSTTIISSKGLAGQAAEYFSATVSSIVTLNFMWNIKNEFLNISIKKLFCLSYKGKKKQLHNCAVLLVHLIECTTFHIVRLLRLSKITHRHTAVSIYSTNVTCKKCHLS